VRISNAVCPCWSNSHRLSRAKRAADCFGVFYVRSFLLLIINYPNGVDKTVRDLQGKVAFVTGGASGVGLALAHAFGRADMKVMLADVEVPALEAAVAKLSSEGIEARAVDCDVVDRASVERAAKEALAAFGKVHVVCSNAGVICGGPIDMIASGDWEWTFGVNLFGAVHCIQIFLPLLKAQGEEGHIVTTASLAGFHAGPGLGPYVASKHALVGLTETLAAELAGSSIGVSMICSGFIRTRIGDSARNRSQRYGPRTSISSTEQTQFEAIIRSGRDPEDIAEKAIRAIKENELYVFTHPEFRPMIEGRFQRIMASYSSADR
jgi:NAD(P)-dependent dehydrogenase (short-subunit alcohol dehydrogenase family)